MPSPHTGIGDKTESFQKTPFCINRDRYSDNCVFLEDPGRLYFETRHLIETRPLLEHRPQKPRRLLET